MRVVLVRRVGLSVALLLGLGLSLLVTARIPDRFRVDPLADIQVLCPTNRGEVGARHLNEVLQQALNGDAPDRITRKRDRLVDELCPDHAETSDV